MATAMASYGFDRMQHMREDDLEESASTRNLTSLSSSSYPAPTSAARKNRSASSRAHDMKMVEIKHNADRWDPAQQQYHSYDPSAQCWLHQQTDSEGHHYRTAASGGATAPRRDYLCEGHSPGERDHLLTQPASPGRPSRASSSALSSTSTATVTFTTTTSSSTTSVTYSSSSSTFYSTSAPPLTMLPAASSASSASYAPLASSPPLLLVYPGSPPPSLKKSKSKKHAAHGTKTKKRVTWVDESMAGVRLEEVIEVERYLKQHGSLGWWLEFVWDNKPYFLLLFTIALLFVASITFIIYKLVF